MKRQYKQMIETRRLYAFEVMFDCSRFANRERSERYLRALCAKVWAKHGRRNVRTPDVAIDHTIDTSFNRGFREIKLAKHQSCVAVLLHEIVHALGYRTHNRDFVRRYIQLLVEYGKCDECELVLAMSSLGIKT